MAQAQRGADICAAVDGAKVVSEDGKFLGTVSSNYDSSSIFNKYGKGSKYDSDSIWNPYGDYGSKYSQNSAMNPYSSSPPMLIKSGKVIGYLSKNKSMGIDPLIVGVMCYEFEPD